jgi:dTMP kinase
MRRGTLVALEGHEASGKSTLLSSLIPRLREQGVAVTHVREPGGTDLGEDLRNILLHQDRPIDPRSELLLFAASRAQLVASIIEPAMQRGELVIADRFILSTLAYQGYGRGLPLEDIRAVNAFSTGQIQPDLTLFLDVPRDVALARIAASGRKMDRMEREEDAFVARVAAGYDLLVASEPGVVRIDGGRTPAEVLAEVEERVARVLARSADRRRRATW